LALGHTHAFSPEVKEGHGVKLTILCNAEEEWMEL
jgi:hypothetical protein